MALFMRHFVFNSVGDILGVFLCLFSRGIIKKFKVGSEWVKLFRNNYPSFILFKKELIVFS